MALFSALVHLEKYHNSELVYDASELDLDKLKFKLKNWTLSKFGHIHG